MNSSSKTPPRFIPTLTEEVAPAAAPEAADDSSAHAGEHSESSSALEESINQVARVLTQPESHESTAPKPRASFHSPWLADGLYVRGQAASIPHELPPLPESLPPQQPFAQSAEVEPASNQAAALIEVPDLPANEVDVNGELDEVEAAGTPKPSQLTASPDSEIPTAFAASISEEQLVNRLMQRIDLVLEQRLKAAIEQVVEAQTRSLVLHLRDELESLVRHSVHEAVESEFEQHPLLTEHLKDR
ncbi:hypothetical protein KUF54_07990 [Comamonas sp. Y33R10-2]|uniref:hypothetical protein n=1 Tax=Comamonas sp. Y33R10-2 TaxID=2853257 RepID=UPI001C5CADE7|nr:hypothetical protein [Comamonas sp. Y33R10-2]QXZ11109.1 hypothetical protein KUF54_07990 [Comamonas sp. Y33R10-2]